MKQVIKLKVNRFRYMLFSLILVIFGSLNPSINWAESEPASFKDQPLLEIRRQAVRNGSPASTQFRLSTEQERAIGWFYYNERPGSPFCTGTVISMNAVLTARHCFEDDPENPKPLINSMHFAVPQDNVGEGNLEPLKSLKFSQQDILISFNYDVAVVRFAQPDAFNITGLKPIPVNAYPLENDFAVNLVGSKVEVVGYGQTLHDGERPGRYFAAVNLDLITPDFLMVNGNNEQGVCRGDSGGPLIAAGVNGDVNIFGVESSGDPCCVGIDQLVRLDLEDVQDLLRYSGAYMPNTNSRSSACWGVSEAGRCQENILQRCFNSQIVEEDCSDRNLSCVYSVDEAGFVCGVNQCVNPAGRCLDQNTVVHCDRGVERLLQCENAYCGFLEGSTRPACLSPVNSSLVCEEKYADSVREASQARFLAEPNCQHSSSPLSNLYLWCFIIMMSLTRSTFKKSYPLNSELTKL